MAPDLSSPKSKFRIERLIFAGLCSVALAGCPDEASKTSSSSTTDRPFVGQTIKISVPSGLGFAEEWHNPLQEWGAETGAAYSISETPGWSGSEPTAPLLTQLKSTLTLFPLTRLGDTIEAKAWQPIPESAKRESSLDWLEIFSGLRENVCAPGREPQLIPLNVPVLVCYYREDLLKKAGISPPQTWTEYHDLLQRLPEWAPGLTAVEPWCSEFRPTLFLARAAAHARHPGHFSFLFDIDTGEPLIDTPGFVRALEQAKADLPLLSKQVLNISPADCRRELLAGRAAVALTFETGPNSSPTLFGPVCANETSSAEAKKTETSDKKAGPTPRPEGMQISFTALPGASEAYNLSTRVWERRSDKSINRASLAGFAGLMAGVSASASPAERDAAWNALAKLSRTEGAPHFPTGTLGITRQSNFEFPRVFAGKSLSENETRQYVNVVARCMQDSQLVLELPIPNRDAYRTALARGVTEVLEGKSEPAKGLKQVAEAWGTLNKATGVEKVRDQYCAGIGLRPIHKLELAPLAK